MVTCPNKSSKMWTKLVNKYGEDKAYIYMNMPNPAVIATDYGYKIDDTLLVDVNNLQVDSPISNLIPLLTDIVEIIDYNDLEIVENNNPFISDDKIAFTKKVIEEDDEDIKKLLNVTSLNISIRDWLVDNDLDTIFKLNPNLTYITDSGEIHKTLLENNIIVNDETTEVYDEIYDMFDNQEVVSFEKRKSEWLLDIIDNDTNTTNKAIAKLLLKKLKYVYDTKVNNIEESSYVDSINIKEANSFLFLQEFLSNILSHVFNTKNPNNAEKNFIKEMSSLYSRYNNTEDFDLNDIKSFVIDTLLNKELQQELNDIDVETELFTSANKLLQYEVNNKGTLLNTTFTTIFKYLNSDSLFENIHKNKEFRKIQQQVNDIDTTMKVLKYMELNNITIYNDNVFTNYVQSLTAKEQRQLYNLMNSETRYFEKSNLTPIISNLQKTYNKLKLVKNIERRLNGNVVKIIPNLKIDVVFNPESNSLIFNKNKYIMTINNNIIYLNGKNTNNIQDLTDYLKSNFNMNVSFNGEVVEEIKKPISDLDRKIQEKIKEITNTPEEEIINQCNF